MNPQLQKALFIALPVVAAIVGLSLVVPAYQHLRADEDDLILTRQLVAQKIPNIELLRNAPKGPPFAHVPATPLEPVEFLKHLSDVTRLCGVRLVRYNRVAVPKVEATPPPPIGPDGKLPAGAKEASKGGLPAGIDPEKVTLTVEGPYANMALFFGRLETYPRLVSISDVTMKSASQSAVRTAQPALITADFTLTRYTTPERSDAGATVAP